jgi:hypothetical protein
VLRRQGYLRPEAVTAVIDRHVSGAEDLSQQLWGLLSFTLWYERHVEGVRRDVELEAIAARDSDALERSLTVRGRRGQCD